MMRYSSISRSSVPAAYVDATSYIAVIWLVTEPISSPKEEQFARTKSSSDGMIFSAFFWTHCIGSVSLKQRSNTGLLVVKNVSPVYTLSFLIFIAYWRDWTISSSVLDGWHFQATGISPVVYFLTE